jgi:hypothetical protein
MTLHYMLLEFRLNSCEARWEAGRAIFYENCGRLVYKRFDAKSVYTPTQTRWSLMPSLSFEST